MLGSRAYLLERISNFSDQSSQPPNLYDYIRAQQLLNHAKKSLSEAVLKILLSAKYSKQWDQRELVFDNEETRYLHRFKPFVGLISPPHPTYDIFVETIDIEEFDVDRMKLIIKKDLGEAKKVLENVLAMTPEETNTEMCSNQFKEVRKCIILCPISPESYSFRSLGNQKPSAYFCSKQYRLELY